jgi:hypothetical protein
MMQVMACRSAYAGKPGFARWTLVAAFLALISLQVVAADHWHGVDEPAHCDVCIHAHDAPVATAIQAIPLLGKAIATVTFVAHHTPAEPDRSAGNRDPPLT